MASWAEDWLSRGCGPLGHTLIAIASQRDPALRCTRCDRREVVGKPTCLVCNNLGQHPAVLYRQRCTAPVAEGVLCDTCAGELFRPDPVEGWWARRPEDEPRLEAQKDNPHPADAT